MSEEEREFETENKLLEDMTLREYNAFLVNNRDKLVELFSTIDESKIADVKETEIIEKEWSNSSLSVLINKLQKN